MKYAKNALLAASLACMVIALSAFGGCASTPNNPQTAVFQVRSNYNAALAVAEAYVTLPLCTEPKTVQVCASKSVVLHIKQAKDVAKAAVDNADAAVNDPQFDASKADAVVTSAKYAVIALTTITADLNLGRK